MSYSRQLTRAIEKEKFKKDTEGVKDKNGNKFKFCSWWRLFQENYYGRKDYSKIIRKNKKRK